MDNIISQNLSFLLPAILFGVVSSLVVLPHFVVTAIKDNWGKVPNDIDKTYLTMVRIGGVAFFPLWITTTWFALFLNYSFSDYILSHLVYKAITALFPVMLCLIVLFLVGLRYDVRGSSSLIRLLTLVVVAAVFPMMGLTVANGFGIFGIHALPAWAAVVVTILLATYIIEMVKLLDGMNGLCSGTVAVVLLLLLLLNMRCDEVAAVVTISSAIGIVIPFWVMKMFSKKWRKVVMGNAGAYIMGFFVAYAFLSSFATPTSATAGHTFVVACAVLLLPALDTLRVIGSRARDSRSIITPDRNHINFKLLRTGMPNVAIFPTYFCLIVFFAAVAVLLLRAHAPLTVVMVAEIALWVVVELVINLFIRRRERRTHQKKWDRVYGREAWETANHSAQIAAKQLLFGILGLSEQYINGDEQAFIADSMTVAERFLKRGADIVVASLCLIIFSPLFLLCYILIKIDDGKTAIFQQERIGRFGRPFYIYKFRTMHLDAEEQGPQLSHAQGENDPRLTRIGRFLRAHHLDELPQLWNVFRGDMTLVGYRPERKYYIDQIMAYDPRYTFLYQIRPGVTSYATLYNGYTDTMEKMLRRLELDLYYLAHRSWWFDCKILFLTFASIIFGKKF